MVNSVFYGSFDLNNNLGGMYIQSRPMGTVQVVQTTTNVARMEGVKKHGEFVGERHIPMTIAVVGSSRSDLENKLDALYYALDQRQQHLSLHALDSRYFIADALYAPAMLGRGEIIKTSFNVDFVCQQPYAFAAAGSSYDSGTVNPPLVSALWQIPQFNVTGGGNKFSRPLITLTNKKVPMAATQLTTALVAGTTYTTIAVSATAAQYNVGDVILLALHTTPPTSPGHTQFAQITATAAAGSTSLSISAVGGGAFIANYSYPLNPGGLNPPSTIVAQQVGWSQVVIQQVTDNQYISVASQTGLANATNATLTFQCDPTVGWSVIDSLNPNVPLLFGGSPPTLNSVATPWLVSVASWANAPSLDVTMLWTARWLS